MPARSTLVLIGFGIVVVGVTVYTLTRPAVNGQSAVAKSSVVVAKASSSPALVSVLAARATSSPTRSTPTPSASTSPKPAQTTKPRPPTTTTPATELQIALPKGPVSAIVFGDSYVAGVGATSPSEGFTEQAMSQLGWNATEVARDDSGYCTTHPADYLQRLKAQPVGPAPTVFILEGGINDVGCSATVLSAQISASIAQVKATYPNALLIVLGPVVPSKYSTSPAGSDRRRT